MKRKTLTTKQRRFVAECARTGNGTEAALVAYDTRDRGVARAIASENLTKPAIHEAVAELLDATGLSDRRLAEIHAHYLMLYRDPDPQMKALGLKALDMALRLKGAYAPERHRVELTSPVQEMSLEELERCVTTGEVPERLRHRWGTLSLESRRD